MAKVIGPNAVSVSNDGGGTTTYLAGTPAGDVDPAHADEIGDHCYVETDADGNLPPARGGLDELVANAPRMETVGPGDTPSGDTGPVPGHGAPQVAADSTAEDADALSEHTVAELEDMCRDRDLPHSGNKSELIARLLDGE